MKIEEKIVGGEALYAKVRLLSKFSVHVVRSTVTTSAPISRMPA